MKTWSFLKNPFLTAAKKSYRQGLKISTYYNAQLLANNTDPFIGSLYANYNLLHIELSSAYNKWAVDSGNLKSNTLSVTQLLNLLYPSTLDIWDYQIMGVYAKNTPAYKGIFPRGRKPFHRGSKESRISAVAQLGKSLSGIPVLASVKADINNFYSQLTSNRQIQLGNKGTKVNRSIKVEDAIEKAMAAMFADYGALINRYINNLNKVEPFFDVNTMRTRNQVTFRKTVPAGKIRTIVQHKFNSRESLSIINDGLVGLNFYLSSTKLSLSDEQQTITVEPGEKLTVPITDFGNIAYRFLNVCNSEIHKGHCVVEVLMV